MIKQDEYATVINHKDTYEDLARMLQDRSVVFAWTDGHGTQLDILMVLHPQQFGYLQRGMKAGTDLFVAVSMHGTFGFEMNGLWKHPRYVGEKLGLGPHLNDMTAELAELINGVIGELRK